MAVVRAFNVHESRFRVSIHANLVAVFVALVVAVVAATVVVAVVVAAWATVVVAAWATVVVATWCIATTIAVAWTVAVAWTAVATLLKAFEKIHKPATVKEPESQEPKAKSSKTDADSGASTPY